MPSSRSAKDICRDDPDGISCKVAKKREKRRKRNAERYGETDAPKPETKKPASGTKSKPVTDRKRYLEDKIREAEGTN